VIVNSHYSQVQEFRQVSSLVFREDTDLNLEVSLQCPIAAY